MSDIEARVVDLELRFMKLERFTTELSDVVADQRKTIEALVAETKRLRSRLAEDEEGAANERPPHY